MFFEMSVIRLIPASLRPPIHPITNCDSLNKARCTGKSSEGDVMLGSQFCHTGVQRRLLEAKWKVGSFGCPANFGR